MLPTAVQFAGCLLGQCLGDALGFLVEGYPPNECEEFVSSVLVPNKVPPERRGSFNFGQYSDDSQLGCKRRDKSAALMGSVWGLGDQVFKGGVLGIEGGFLVCLLRLDFLSSLSFFGFAEPVAFSVGLDELHAVGKSIDERAGEPFVAEDLGPVLEGQVGGEDKALAFVCAADDVEEKFGADFGEGDVAKLTGGSH
jgi:hypothetical protein